MNCKALRTVCISAVYAFIIYYYYYSLWLIMRSYGIPSKIISMMKAFYDDFACAVVDSQSIERSGLTSKRE